MLLWFFGDPAVFYPYLVLYDCEISSLVYGYSISVYFGSYMYILATIVTKKQLCQERVWSPPAKWEWPICIGAPSAAGLSMRNKNKNHPCI